MAGIARDLRTRIRGEARDDVLTRGLFATDASIYQVPPRAVVFPREPGDIQAVCEYGARRGIPVVPRGGGTSLCGQSIGPAILCDFSRHMTDVLAVDPAGGRARVQPGVVLDELNGFLEPHGVSFAPDPASGSRCTVGGMVGTNAAGGRSLVHGTTRDHLLSLDLVLADGSRDRTEPVPLDGEGGGRLARVARRVGRACAEAADVIEDGWPDLHRNNAGYHLPGVLEDGQVDLVPLVAGSEGTLATVVSADLRLTRRPAKRALAVCAWSELRGALEVVPAVLERGPSACELLDDLVIGLARTATEFRDAAGLPRDAGGVLLVEHQGDDPVAVAAEAERTARLARRHLGAAWTEGVIDDGRQARFWALRKAGLALLQKETGDAKRHAFVEDAAVPPEHLPAYVEAVEEIFRAHGSRGAYYAHAGAGELHVRPTVNLETAEGLRAMREIARAVFEVVRSFGGVMSGEHGDGLARTRWVRGTYGDDLWSVFREVKEAFDPGFVLNPGKVVPGPGGEVPDPTENLRYGPAHLADPWTPTLDFSDQEGLDRAIEMCHGCGGCRTRTTGVMCPTFRATGEEATSTRGRANALRLAISGTIGPEMAHSERMRSAIVDLCMGCKACKRECPSEVDLARIRADWLHERDRRRGIPDPVRVLFGHADWIAEVAGRTAPLSRWLLDLAPVRWLAERTLGIDRTFSMPPYGRDSFRAWLDGEDEPRRDDGPTVVLLADCITDRSEPEIGRSAVEVLRAAGARIVPAPVSCCGRAATSNGLLHRARRLGRRLVRRIDPLVREGAVVCGTEPSCLAMLRDDLPRLVGGEGARRVAGATRDLFEWLEEAPERLRAVRERLDPGADPARFVHHGHCQAKACRFAGSAARVLGDLPGVEVGSVDAACCGMAGSWGAMRDHRSIARWLGRDLVGKLDEAGGRPVAAGASCRAQLEAHGREAEHPVVAVGRRLRRPPASSGDSP